MVNLLQAQEGRIERIWRSILNGRFEKVFVKLDKLFYPENEGKQAYEKDLTIAYIHIGGQYNANPSSFTKRVTDWFLNHGCDIVVDNHEHVVHGSKFVDKKIAVYALGNCLGSAGVLHAPFDRKAEYSIALHTYIDERTKKIDKASFSVLKTIIGEDEKYEIWPVADLLKQLQGEAYDTLKNDCFLVAKYFSGNNYESIEPEFII